MSNLPAPPPAAAKGGKGLLGRMTGAVTGRVVETVDPDVVLEHVDVDALVQRIDVEALLARVDLNALIDRVDLDALLDRVDVDRLIDRIDVDRIVSRVDVNGIVSGVDLEGLVRRSGIPDLVAESTGAVAGSALDVARRQLVGLDVIIERVVDRLLRRTPDPRFQAPPLLRDVTGESR